MLVIGDVGAGVASAGVRSCVEGLPSLDALANCPDCPRSQVEAPYQLWRQELLEL